MNSAQVAFERQARMELDPKVGLDRRRADDIENSRPESMSQVKRVVEDKD